MGMRRASASSAAEKLLLQARPGAAEHLRSLAIRSLGVLGKPEALPFLIDNIERVLEGLPDTVGQFYRFSLAASLLHGGRS